ncbi:unnamed protein product [Cuscuta epithymum]|uniref:Uncharacterized protein n=1 Tax=Cuscuta epithymum TaxID=186058 RepID=A0AAV0FJ76_9ASTE|nr:unnamed protein product [Cuscuta epithymum]
MQTPKPRNRTSDVPQRKRSPQSVPSKVPTKISPRAVSNDVPRKVSPRTSSHNAASQQKISPRIVRQLLPNTASSTTSSPHSICSSKKQRSPKANEQGSPKASELSSPHSLGSEEHSNRRSELESQILELQNDLKKVKEELHSTEALKDQANQEADDSKRQLSHLSSKLQESQEQLMKRTPVPTLDESIELQNLKESLSETLLIVEELKTQLSNCRESEARAESLINEKHKTFESEIETLQDALDASEAKIAEEQTRSTVEIRGAYEFVEQIISSSNQKEAELRDEVQKLSIEIEELKANLMDKETELQGICEENENLALKLENRRSGQREYELEREVRYLKEKLTEMKMIYEENGRRSEGIMEQMEVVEAYNAEMEEELRRVKVQSEQWRKAAEAASAMLSSGAGMISAPPPPPPCFEEGDEDLQKRKNANVLKRISSPWKKIQK